MISVTWSVSQVIKSRHNYLHFNPSITSDHFLSLFLLMVIDQIPFNWSGKQSRKLPKGLTVDKAIHVCRGISVLILCKLRSQASTDVGGQKGGIASNGRNKIDFPGSMVSHSLHTANLCYVVWESTQLARIVSHLLVKYSDKASFSLWTSYTGTTLLEICLVCMDFRITS